MMRNGVQAVLRRNQTLQVIVTLIIGCVGAAIAYVAALPAAALIGATVAVSAASFCRHPTRIPDWMRNMAFAAIGCSLGSGVDGDLLELAIQWPLSLCGLILVMGVILYASSWVLTTLFNQTRETALLASSPGALSYSLAIAATGVGDARSIIVIQSIRLLSITTALPLVLDLLHLQHGGGGGGLQHNSTLVGTAGLFVLTLGLGFVMNRRRIPAA
jgi:membrane AbrB-like protein